MKILIYIPGISKAWGGAYQYTLGVLRTLSKDSSNSYLILNEGEDETILEIINKNNNFILLSPEKVLRHSFFKRFLRMVNKIFSRVDLNFSLNVIGEVDQYLLENNIDIVYSTHQYLPNLKISKSICTMHDVQELHFPEYFSSGERIRRAIEYKRSIDQANAIIVSYDHIKKDIIKFFAKSEANVFVCLFDLNTLWFSQYDNSVVADSKIRLPFDAYILYPAATWEHKNHVNLLVALAEVNKVAQYNVNLVCTGAKTHFYSTVLEPLVEKLGLTQNVQFLGVVDDLELTNLYIHAQGVIIPTLYEAGSFPLYESIFLNVPVICSNVTSLPVTIGDEIFLFDPRKPNEIANKIISLCYDSKFRIRSCYNNGIRRGELLKSGFFESLMNVFDKVANK